MRDYAFFTAGCGPGRGLGKLVVLVRRLLRRILRPMLLRQVELFEGLDRDIAEANERIARLEGAFVDRGAIARRLAVIEDRLEALTQQIQMGAEFREQARGVRKAS